MYKEDKAYKFVENIPLNTVAPFFDFGRTGAINPLGSRQSKIEIVDIVTMAGDIYQNILVFSSTCNRLALAQGHGIFSLHNLEGCFKVLKGHIGHIDGESMIDATISFWSDSNLLYLHQLLAVDPPVPISISVEYVHKLRILVEFSNVGCESGSYGLCAFLN